MTRQLDAIHERRTKKRQLAIVAAVEYALQGAIEHSGAEYLGFAAKCMPGECLVTIKGILAGRAQVAFVGAEDLGGALIKAVRLGRSDKLKWKPDRYAKPE